MGHHLVRYPLTILIWDKTISYSLHRKIQLIHLHHGFHTHHMLYIDQHMELPLEIPTPMWLILQKIMDLRLHFMPAKKIMSKTSTWVTWPWIEAKSHGKSPKSQTKTRKKPVSYAVWLWFYSQIPVTNHHFPNINVVVNFSATVASQNLVANHQLPQQVLWVKTSSPDLSY